MAAIRLTQTRILAGIWQGVLTGAEVGAAAAPELLVTLLEVPVPGVTVTPLPQRPGEWAVQVPIPASALSEGVQTFLIQEAATGARLAHFTIIAGVGLEDDLRAEMDLLRAELDMLKKAFRRHCVETGG